MEKNEKNISKIIERYPFNGRSNYLIDKFYIIGYNIQTLLKILYEVTDDTLSNNIILDKKQNDEEKNKSSLNLQPFHLNEVPILLNEITSDFNKDIDFEKIKEMMLPNNLTLYYSEEDITSYLNINYENENDEFIGYEEDDY